MIYRIEMTEAQHAWLVEDLAVEYVIHKTIPRDDRGIELDELRKLKDAVKSATIESPPEEK